MDGAPSAPAQRLHLQHLHPVGEFNETSRSRKKPRPKVRQDSEGIDIDSQLINQACHLLDLRLRIKLSLIADEVINTHTCTQLIDDESPEIEVVSYFDGGYSEPQPARQHRLTRAIKSCEDDAGPPSGTVVVVRLQGQSALAAIHRSGVEHEFGHGANAATTSTSG